MILSKAVAASDATFSSEWVGSKRLEFDARGAGAPISGAEAPSASSPRLKILIQRTCWCAYRALLMFPPRRHIEAQLEDCSLVLVTDMGALGTRAKRRISILPQSVFIYHQSLPKFCIRRKQWLAEQRSTLLALENSSGDYSLIFSQAAWQVRQPARQLQPPHPSSVSVVQSLHTRVLYIHGVFGTCTQIVAFVAVNHAF